MPIFTMKQGAETLYSWLLKRLRYIFVVEFAFFLIIDNNT